MTALTGEDIAQLFVAMADKIEQEKDHLSALDGVIGDGDHGVTMSIGFQAVDNALKDQTHQTPSDVFNLAAKTFLNAVGASAGPLYATAFMRAGAALKGQDSLRPEALADAVIAMSDGIAHRGKAGIGEKTMVDAWAPAAEAAATQRSSGSFTTIMKAAADAAWQGADGTAEMVATKGRSANLGERSLGHVDPGAASAAILLATMRDWLANKEA